MTKKLLFYVIPFLCSERKKQNELSLLISKKIPQTVLLGLLLLGYSNVFAQGNEVDTWFLADRAVNARSTPYSPPSSQLHLLTPFPPADGTVVEYWTDFVDFSSQDAFRYPVFSDYPNPPATPLPYLDAITLPDLPGFDYPGGNGDYLDLGTILPAGNPTLQRNEINFNPAIEFDGADNGGVGQALQFRSVSREAITLFIVFRGEGAGNSAESQRLLFGGDIDDHTASTTNLSLGISDGNRFSVGRTWRDGLIEESSWAEGTFNLNNQPTIGVFSRTLMAGDEHFYTKVNGLEDINVLFYAGSDNSRNLFYFNSLGRHFNSNDPNRNLTGQIAEVILVDVSLNADYVQRIESYLAIKYGITLNNNADLGSIVGNDNYTYLASDGTPIWQIDTDYKYDIAGIGKDRYRRSVATPNLFFNIHQTIAKSENTEAIVTIATNPDFISDNFDPTRTTIDPGPTSTAYRHNYLLWGSDRGSINETNIELPPALPEITSRIQREWKVQKTENIAFFEDPINGVSIRVELSGSDILNHGNCALKLLIDTDGNGDFTNGPITVIDASNIDSGNVFFDNVDFEDQDVFTIAFGDIIPPTASNPAPLNVQCAAPAPDPAVVTDEADNCGVPTVSFVSDSSDGNANPETITRTYSVTDASGNSINVEQTITINDTTDPTASTSPLNLCAISAPAPDPLEVINEMDNCDAPADLNIIHISDSAPMGSDPVVITRTYRVTDTSGNSTDVDQIISLYPSPNAGSNNMINICVDDSSVNLVTSLGGSPDNGGSWNDDDMAMVNLVDPTSVDFTGIAVGIYSFTYTVNPANPSSPCPPASATVVVTINDNPTIASAGSNLNQCSDGDFTMAANTPTEGIGTWTQIMGPVVTIDNENSPTTDVIGLPIGQSATLRWTISNGICSDSSDDIIITNNQPVMADAPGNEVACGSYTLPALSNGNYFDMPNGGGNMLSAGDNITNVGVNTIYVYSPSNGVCPAVENSFTVTIDQPVMADAPGNQVACGSYTLPALSNGNYFDMPNGGGNMLSAGDNITNVGMNTIYVYSPSNGVCPAVDNSFTITIDQPVMADAPGNEVACGSYTLPALSNGNYFDAPNGGGNMLSAGDNITNVGVNTIYVYSPSNGVCPAVENSFTVTIDQPVMADAPGNQVACGSYTLPALTNGNYFDMPNGGGNMLSTGDDITNVGVNTIYVYSPANGVCPPVENSFTVTIDQPVMADAPGNQVACGSYTLPALSNGNYFDLPNGGGNMLSAGDNITNVGVNTIYVYSPANGVCPAVDNSFTITIDQPVMADAPGNEVACGSYTLPALSNGNYFDAPNGGGNMLSAGDNITNVGVNTIYVYSPSNGVCPAVDNSFTVTIDQPVMADAPGNEVACGSYTLPALSNGNYFDGAGGTGNMLSAGDNITNVGVNTIYVYSPENGVCPAVDNSFTVTINAIPTVALNASTDPSTCGGNDGQIVLDFTNVPDGNHDIAYDGGTFNAVPVLGGQATINGLVQGDYHNLSISINGCTSTQDVDVTLSDPSIPAAPMVGPQAFCSADNPTGNDLAPAIGGGITWYSDVGLNNTVDPADVLATQDYFVTQTINGCEGPATTVAVTVNNTPTVTFNASTDPSTCGGNDGQIVLDFTNVPDGNHDIAYDGGTFNAVPVLGGQATINGLVQGDYDNLSISINGCTSTQDVDVTLSDPAIPNAPMVGPQAFCSADNPTGSDLVPVIGGGITWYSDVGLNNTVDPADVLATQDYFVTQTINGCEGPATTVAVTIDTPAMADAPGNEVACGSYTLPALSNGNYFDMPNGGGNMLSAGDNITNVGVNTIYVYSPANGACPAVDNSFTVTIDATPTIAINGFTDPTICGGNDGQITLEFTNVPNGNQTINHDGGNFPVVVAANTATITGLSAGNYDTLSITVSGCTSTDDPSVTLSDPPTPGAPNANNQDFCSADNPTGSDLVPVIGGGITWYSDAGLNNTVDPADVLATQDYFVTLTTNGCEGPATTVAVTIDTPAMADAPGNEVACGSYTLPALSNGNYFDMPNGGGNMLSAGDNITNVGVNTIYVYSPANGVCPAVDNSFTVTINAIPTVALNASTNPSTCGGNDGQIVLDFTNVPDGNHDIAYDGGTFNAVPVLGGQATINGLVQGDYDNLSISINGCTSTQDVDVTLSDPAIPNAPMVGPQAFCSADNPTGNDLVPAIGSGITWYSDAGLNNTVDSADVLATQDYFVTQTTNGCEGPATTVAVTVNNTPTVTFNASTDPSTCGGNDGQIVLEFTGLPNGNHTVDYDGGSLDVFINAGTAFVNNLSAGEYNNLSITRNGCTSVDNPNVVLTDPVTPTIAVTSFTNPTTCNGNDGQIVLEFTGLPNGNHTVDYDGGSFNVFINNGVAFLNNLSAGEYNNLSITRNGCTSVDDPSVVLTDPTTPTITVASSSNPTTCNGNDGQIVLEFTGLPNGNHTVDYDGGSFNVFINAGTAFVNNLSAGEYNNLSITRNGCTSVDDPSVVLADPVTPTLAVTSSSNPTTCNGNDGQIVLEFTGLPNGNHTVDYDGGSLDVFINAGTAFVNNLSAGEYNNLSITRNGCTSVDNPSVVLTDPTTPTITVTSFSNPTTCNGNDGQIVLEFTGLPNGNHTVDYDGGSLDVFINAGTAFVNNLSSGEYNNLSITRNGCTSVDDPSVVLIDPIPPSAPIVSNQSFCSADNPTAANLIPIIGEGITWYSDAGLSNTVNPLDSLTTQDYFVTQTINGCESPATTVTVTVNNTPEAPMIEQLDFCSTDNPTGNDLIPAIGNGITWYSDAGLSSIVNPADALVTQDYFVTQTTNGCESPATTIVVTINTPVMADAPADQTVCGSYTLPALSNGNYFDAPEGGGNMLNVGDNISESTTLYVFSPANGTCPAVDNSFTITINSLSVFIDLAHESCWESNDGSIEITIESGTAPYTIALNSASVEVNSDSNITMDELAPGNYTLSITDANGCESISEFDILPGGPNLDATIEPIYSCESGFPANTISVSLTNSSIQNEVLYALDSTNPEVFILTPEFGNIQVGDHFLSILHTNGCLITIPFTIENIPPLALSLVNSNTNEITANASGGAPPYTYFFENNPGTSDNTFTIDRNGTFVVRVVDGNGCEVLETITVNFIDIEIPNFFTPNNDGQNDFWRPRNVEPFSNIETFIFDRYGRKIKIMGPANEGWDGFYESKPMPSGDYWYIIELNDGSGREFVGHFTLYR